MGRHSAPDDDEEPEGTGVAVDEPEAGPDRRGRHSRGLDVETTGPVPGVAVRKDEERAAAQDERPTERIDLAAIEAAVRQDEAPPGEAPPGEAPPADAPAGTADTHATGPLEALLAEAPPAEAAPAEAPLAPAPAKKRPRGAQSTTADLALIRRHPEIRNRVVGAAIAPFVLYAIVLLVLTAKGAQYLLWIWIPTVTAGVLIGFVLDSGHKRYPDES